VSLIVEREINVLYPTKFNSYNELQNASNLLINKHKLVRVSFGEINVFSIKEKSIDNHSQNQFSDKCYETRVVVPTNGSEILYRYKTLDQFHFSENSEYVLLPKDGQIQIDFDLTNRVYASDASDTVKSLMELTYRTLDRNNKKVDQLNKEIENIIQNKMDDHWDLFNKF
jgi:hypothetical protein